MNTFRKSNSVIHLAVGLALAGLCSIPAQAGTAAAIPANIPASSILSNTTDFDGAAFTYTTQVPLSTFTTYYIYAQLSQGIFNGTPASPTVLTSNNPALQTALQNSAYGFSADKTFVVYVVTTGASLILPNATIVFTPQGIAGRDGSVTGMAALEGGGNVTETMAIGSSFSTAAIQSDIDSAAGAAIIDFTAPTSSYVVNQIDYVDFTTGTKAACTQIFSNNNSGQVIGLASPDPACASGDFTFLYDPSSGRYTPLPQPPGFTGFAQAIGINDLGVITGITTEPAGERGFILNGSTYTFFANPGWLDTSGRSIGNPTAAHPQGLIVGYNDTGGICVGCWVGFVYDPVSSVFTALSTPNSVQTIVQGLNTAGQITGNVRSPTGTISSFLFTPTSGTDPTLGGTIAYFQINGLATRARGINDNGVITASVTDAAHNIQAYVGTSNGYQQINVPQAGTGPNCATFDVLGEGLNNAGQVNGFFQDSACNYHGFIATPASMPSGTSSNGAYTFNVNVVANVPIFIDPKVAIGYDYHTGKKNPRFATVRFPLGIGDNEFILVFAHTAYSLNAGQLFDFTAHGYPKGVTAFRVACIDPAAMLDPANSLAFPTGLTFVTSGTFTGTQKPVASATGLDGDPKVMKQTKCRERILAAKDPGGGDPDSDD